LTLRYSLLLSVWVDPSAEHIHTYIQVQILLFFGRLGLKVLCSY